MFRSLATFSLVYLGGVICLFLVKFLKGYPDYVIPGPGRLLETIVNSVAPYSLATIGTFLVALAGHLLSFVAAVVLACCVVIYPRLGSLVRSVAYTIQSYPLIATAPIFFILLDDGLAARLAITASICYFPMLLTFIGVLSQPIPQVEHFYRSCGRLNARELVRLRFTENIEVVTTAFSGAAVLAVVGAILAEFLGADAGIGYAIRVALYRNRLDSILAALLVIGIANWIFLTPLEWLGRYLVVRTNGTTPGETEISNVTR